MKRARRIKPVKAWRAWAIQRDDMPGFYEVSEYRPSLIGIDEDGAEYQRYGKVVRVEIRPVPPRRPRKKA